MTIRRTRRVKTAAETLSVEFSSFSPTRVTTILVVDVVLFVFGFGYRDSLVEVR